ncbi:transcriptional regulator, partial [bacterium]|nr:transcriptional regulator [bacterium]
NLNEKFSSSNMLRCRFNGSDMSRLLLKSNNVSNCDFTGSDLSVCSIKMSNLSGNIFKNCSLREAELLESFIRGCDFTGADFTGTIHKYGGLEKNEMADAVLNHTSYISMHLVDLVFTGTIENCFFENCAYTRVRFENATLLNTFFKGNRKLKRISFINCKADRMTYEFLKQGKADLTGISLLS